MVWLARPENNPKLKEYLDERKIKDYVPEEMDMVVMTEHQLEIFGMFLTSDLHHPNRVNIHFMVNGKSQPSVTYDHDKDQFTVDPEFFKKAYPELTAFVKLASRVESKYGRQQIEVALSKDDGKVYLFQSRDFRGVEAWEVPRYKEYRTMDKDLIAEGFAHLRAPVVVVGDLRSAVPYENKEYKKLETEYETLTQRINADIEADNDFTVNEQKRMQVETALDNIRNEAVRQYAQEIKARVQGQDYILLLSDPEALGLATDYKEDLTLFKEIAGPAKVIIGQDTMNMVGHAIWNPLEAGGTIVTAPPNADFPWSRFVHHKSGVSADVIQTGDVMEFLSNPDGVFLAPVTPDGQGVGIGEALKGDTAMTAMPGGIDLSAKHYNLTIVSAGGLETQFNMTDAQLPSVRFSGVVFHIESITPFSPMTSKDGNSTKTLPVMVE